MIIDGDKLACDTCIRGHRATRCQHTDRPLRLVGVKGRPVSQCQHCRSLRQSRSVHTMCKCATASKGNSRAGSNGPGTNRCRCCSGEACICAPAQKPPNSNSNSPSSMSPSLMGDRARMDTTDSSPYGLKPEGSGGCHEPQDEKQGFSLPPPNEEDSQPSNTPSSTIPRIISDPPIFDDLVTENGTESVSMPQGEDSLPSALMGDEDVWALDLLSPLPDFPFTDNGEDHHLEFWEMDGRPRQEDT